MNYRLLLTTCLACLISLCPFAPTMAQKTIKLTTTKRTSGHSNKKKFNVEICVTSPQDVIIDWGDGRVDTTKVETTSPENGPSKQRRHFQDGKNEHTVTILGQISYLKVNGQKLKSVDLTQASDLKELSITSESNLTALDLSACPALKKLTCSSNGLTSLRLPKGLSTLDCSGNALGIADLPDLYSGMSKEDYLFGAQRPHAIESSLIRGLKVDLTSYNNRRGVTAEPQQTTFTWYDADGNEIDHSKYQEKDGLFTFSEQPATPIYCKYSTPAFPEVLFTTLPIELQSTPSELYRFGYSYGTPSARGSEKAGGKLWYAAGPLFTKQELEPFAADKIVGVRVYLHQDYLGSKVFIRSGLDHSKGNLLEKLVDLKAGWNEIFFDKEVEVPQDSLLAAYFIRTENKSDVVLAGDRSVFNVNHLWEMIQDRQEAPDPSAPFYETTWINSSKDLPAAPVQVLLQGDDPAHFENRVAVVGFYPPFYAPISAQGECEFPILLANKGLNKIDQVTVKYSFDRGPETTIQLPVSLEPYQQQTVDGDHLRMSIPYRDTERHTLSLQLASVNGVDGHISNASWSQLTQGYHKDKVFPRTPLVETLMSEGDPFAANAEKNLTSLLASRNWTGHNIVRMDYHLGVGDRPDAYELPEVVFNDAVGRFAITGGEPGYTSDQETVIPSIMVDRDIMTNYALYLCKGSPFLPILDNNSLAKMLIQDAIDAPGFAELSIIQSMSETPQATRFSVSGVISRDLSDVSNLSITLLLIEEDLVGTQTIFDPFRQEIVEQEGFVHAPTVRAFITSPQGEPLTVADDMSYQYDSPDVTFQDMNPDKCKVVAFIHKNSSKEKLNNMVLNSTASTVEVQKINAVSPQPNSVASDITCAIIHRALAVSGETQSVALYDAQGRVVPTEELTPGLYIAKVVDMQGVMHIFKLLCH